MYSVDMQVTILILFLTVSSRQHQEKTVSCQLIEQNNTFLSTNQEKKMNRKPSFYDENHMVNFLLIFNKFSDEAEQ